MAKQAKLTSSWVSRTIGCGVLAVGTVLLGAIANSTALHAQTLTYSVLYTFTGGADGGQPDSPLIADDDGNLYGTCYLPSVVFKVDQAGNETVLYSFTGGDDGQYPGGDIVRDAAGNLYGAASGGGGGTRGGQGGRGVVFKVDPAGNETVLHRFREVDGDHPWGLLTDSRGELYGVAGGGTGGWGVIYELDSTGEHFRVLYNFTGGISGGSPNSPLARDPAGNLYGTGATGGAYNNGVVFELDAAGNYTVLYNFSGGTDGGDPLAGLVLDSAGNLYGTTDSGGNLNRCFSSGCGVVFKLDPAGNETVLSEFTGGPDGYNPRSTLVYAANSLYGTTQYGGDERKVGGCFLTGCGVVFKARLSPGPGTVLHTFTSSPGDDSATSGPFALQGIAVRHRIQWGDLSRCGIQAFTAV